MKKVLSHRERSQQAFFQSIDDREIYLIYEPQGRDRGGRKQLRMPSLKDPCPGVSEAVPVFTSRLKAQRCLAALQSTDWEGASSFRVFGVADGCRTFEQRSARLLRFLDDKMLPDCLIWDWDGRNMRDVPRSSRQAICDLILGDSTKLDTGPNKRIITGLLPE